MKERLEKMLAAKKEQRDNLNAALIESDSKEERTAIGDTLRALGAEISDIEAMIAEADKPAEGGTGGERNLGVLSTLESRTIDGGSEDMYSTVAYRKAFQKYIATGDKTELRATTKTTDTNVDTVIPENLANKILEKMEQLGVIKNLVTKTAFPVGQAFPVDGVKPTATWVGRATTLSNSTTGEGSGSTAQNKTLGALITFSHFKLRCEIAMTEEVVTMTLPMFEALFIKQVSEAMLRAQEFAIVEGDGYGMPTGILNETAPTGQAYEIAAAKDITYKDLCAIEGLIPAEYESTTKWCMTKKTFMSIIGMTDTAGQPIARVNYGIDGKPERTLLGRDVVIYAPQTGSKLKDYTSTVTADSIVAFLFDFSDYILNENYNLGIQHKQDWDNEDHKTKAVLACDGKVLIKDSLITVTKKKAASGS